MLGRAAPPRTAATLPQKAGADSLRFAISLVGRRNAAAATALAREVSGVKNPAPSPRADKTKRPASSTTVAVIGVPSSRAFACAALTAFSAISSVSSAMPISTPFRVQILLRPVAVPIVEIEASSQEKESVGISGLSQEKKGINPGRNAAATD